VYKDEMEGIEMDRLKFFIKDNQNLTRKNDLSTIMKLFHYALMSWEWKMYIFIRFIFGVARDSLL